jgi:hypothetical protein
LVLKYTWNKIIVSVNGGKKFMEIADLFKVLQDISQLYSIGDKYYTYSGRLEKILFKSVDPAENNNNFGYAAQRYNVYQTYYDKALDLYGYSKRIISRLFKELENEDLPLPIKQALKQYKSFEGVNHLCCYLLNYGKFTQENDFEMFHNNIIYRCQSLNCPFNRRLCICDSNTVSDCEKNIEALKDIVNSGSVSYEFLLSDVIDDHVHNTSLYHETAGNVEQFIKGLKREYKDNLSFIQKCESMLK